MTARDNPPIKPITHDEDASGIIKSALASADMDFLHAIAHELQCLPIHSKEESNTETLKDEIARKIISFGWELGGVETYSEGLKELKGSDVLLVVNDENAYRFYMLLYNGMIDLDERLNRTNFPRDTYGKKEFIADLIFHLDGQLKLFGSPEHLKSYLQKIIFSYKRGWREIFQNEEKKRLCELWNDEFFSSKMVHNAMKELHMRPYEPVDPLDILISMDQFFNSNTGFRKIFVRKISDKVRSKRNKANSGTGQKNLALKNEIINALKELHEAYNKSETVIVSCLIMEELKNPTHLKNIFKYIKN